MSFTNQEAKKIETYLQKKFSNPKFSVKARKTDDSVEVLIDGEFIGIIYKDEEDGETCYNFSMAILDMDLAA